MAANNPFTGMSMVAPDLQQNETQIQRQQALAQLLMQQGMTPIDTSNRSTGRLMSAVSPWEGVSKAASSLLGAYGQQKADASQADLNKQYQGRMAEMLNGMMGGESTPPSPAQAALTTGAQAGSVGPTVANAERMDAMPQPSAPNPQVNQLKRAAMSAYMMGNTDLANKLIGNMLEMTNEQKNNSYMGISGKEAGGFERAKRTKEGIMEYQPGNMTVNLANGQRTVAPDFKSGTQGGFDANGNPIMASIPGSSILAQMEGDKARAVAQAQAGYKTQKVDKAGGPVLMTDRQVVDEATGGNGGFPAGTRIPSATPNHAGGDRLSIMQRERSEIMARPDSDPRKAGDLKAIDSEIARLPQQKGAGIPLQDELTKARQTASLGIQTDSLKTLTKDADAMRGMVPVFDQIESLIKQGTLGNGPMDKLKMIGHNAGMQNQETINTANLEKLGHQLVLSRGSLGAGVSVSDAERYDKAAGDFTKAQSNQEKLKYLGIMRNVIQSSYGRANEAIKSFNANGSVPAYGAPTFDASKEARYQEWKARQGK